MAVASHPLLPGLPDGSLQRGDLGFDALSSLTHSPQSSRLTGGASDCGTSPLAVSSQKLPSGVPDDSRKSSDLGFDPLSSLHGCLKASKLAENTDSTALPVNDRQNAEAAVRSERDDDDDVVVLSDSEGPDRPRKEVCCADVASVLRRDEEHVEEVGDVVILEPAINKEVPVSICRETSSPRLYEEYVIKPDEPSEDTDTHGGRVTGCSVGKPSQQSATCQQQQSGGASRGCVAARSWRKLATRKPRYQLTCSSCLKLFLSKYELIRHVFVHVDDVEPPHICVMCGEVFATEEEEADHHKSVAAQCYAFVPVVKMLVRSADVVWFCSTCEQTFQSQHQLAIHKAERHLRTVISARTELPVSAAKLCDLPQVRVDIHHGRKCKIKGGRPPGLPLQEPFQRNYKRKLCRPSIHLQETPHSNHKRKPSQPVEERTTPEITVKEPLNMKTGRKQGRSPSNINGEPRDGNPYRRKPEMLSELDANRLQEVIQGESLNRTPEMASGEPVHRINDATLNEPLCRIPETAREEPHDRSSTVAPTPESLQNKSGIMPGEPFDSKPGMTPDHLIDIKPKKKRGRPPGSKNKGPSKPRARKSKPILGELRNGTPEVAGLQVMGPGECTDGLLEITPGVLDELRSGAPLDRQYETKSGKYLYDLIPGELPNRPHEMTLGEHLYRLHEIGPREQLYTLHEMIPEMSLDSNPDATPRESLDKLHDTTQGEPLYRLHEMTTVESVHRLHEMSPVEILYRNHESTPISPLDKIPKIATEESLSSLHEMTPMSIHYRNSESKYQESTSGSPLNTIPKTSSVEPFHRQSEMEPREPLHKLTEMAPVEPVHRHSEMTPAETIHKQSKMAPGEPLHRLSQVPPQDTLRMLSEMEPRDPLHTLFEMATGDPFHTLFEMEPGDSFSSPSKMLPGEPYNGLSQTAPGEHLNCKSEMAQGNFFNGMPRKRRGRPPGSKNKFPGKPRRKSKTEPGEPLCTKPETISGEAGDKLPATPEGAPSNGVPEILLGESGDKKPNKNSGETEKWPCNFCRQLFCSLSGLKRHLVRHTGERNYICDLCGKSFGRSDNLRVHKYTHTGGLPYKCDICGRAFSWACHLRDHKRRCQSS